jgi:hypothetical protein
MLEWIDDFLKTGNYNKIPKVINFNDVSTNEDIQKISLFLDKTIKDRCHHNYDVELFCSLYRKSKNKILGNSIINLFKSSSCLYLDIRITDVNDPIIKLYLENLKDLPKFMNLLDHNRRNLCDDSLTFYYDILNYSYIDLVNLLQNLNERLPNFINKYIFDPKNEIKKHLYENVKIDENNICILELLMNNNYELELIKKIYDELDITPTVIDLEYANSPALIRYLLSKKIIPNHKCFEKVRHLYEENEVKQELINLLIFHGYELTYDDMKEVTRSSIQIYNFDNYNFPDDGELFKICVGNDFRPSYFSKLKKNDDIEYENLNVQKLKLYIKKGFIPTIDTLRQVCELCNNPGKLIEYLLDYGVKPNLECLKNIISRRCEWYVQLIFNNLYEKMEINNNKKIDYGIELLDIPDDYNKSKIYKLSERLIDFTINENKVFKKDKYSFKRFREQIESLIDYKKEIDLDTEFMHYLINPEKKKIKIPYCKLDSLVYTIFRKKEN